MTGKIKKTKKEEKYKNKMVMCAVFMRQYLGLIYAAISPETFKGDHLSDSNDLQIPNTDHWNTRDHF